MSACLLSPQGPSNIKNLDFPFFYFIFFIFYLFIFFWLCPRHAEVPVPGIEPAPQQQP